jgi:hypothetical protein
MKKKTQLNYNLIIVLKLISKQNPIILLIFDKKLNNKHVSNFGLRVFKI